MCSCGCRPKNNNLHYLVGGKLNMEKITDKDKEDIRQITSAEEIMKFLGNGKTLNNKQFDEFMDNIKSGKEKFFKLTDKNKLIGIIGISEFLKYPSLTIALKKEEQGKGYLKKALELFAKEYNKNFFIIVKENNKKMLNIANKHFKYVGRRLLYGVKYVYIYEYSV